MIFKILTTKDDDVNECHLGHFLNDDIYILKLKWFNSRGKKVQLQPLSILHRCDFVYRYTFLLRIKAIMIADPQCFNLEPNIQKLDRNKELGSSKILLCLTIVYRSERHL